MIKILIYGAGVIGSIFAYRLKTGGNDVTILARRKRLEQLRKEGLVLRDDMIHKEFHCDINVTDKLNPEDEYDIILVIMQRQQISSILPIISKNKKSPTVIFLGNNVNGAEEYLQYIDKEKILLGFGGPGGYREEGVVVIAYIDKAIMYFGELDGNKSRRVEEITDVFEKSGIKIEVHENIDAWLKTHMAFISALAMASYAARKRGHQYGEDDELIKMSVIAMIENFRALKELGIPIIPKKFKLLRYMPKSSLVKKIKNLINSEFGRIALSGHANAAKDEMKSLTDDFMNLVMGVKTDLSTNDKLYDLSFA